MVVTDMKPRINGQMMADHQGKAVTLLGRMSDVDSSGMSFKLKTSDNIQVTVHLQEPNQEYLSGIIEVKGKVTSKTTILCNSFVIFPSEQTEDFNIEQYNEAVKILQTAKVYSPE